MSWVKLDDGMPDSLKIAPLSDAAFRAYVTSICYAARNLTDGFVPLTKAKSFAGRSRVFAELMPALWVLAPGGITIHDYDKYNPTKAQVLAAKAEASAEKSAGGKARASGATRAGGRFTSGSTSSVTSSPPAAPPAEHQQRHQHITSPDPDPDPDLGISNEIPPPTARARKARRGRGLEEIDLEKAADEHPLLDVGREHRVFCNDLKQKGKTWTDYVAAFDNWLIKAEEFRGRDGERERLQAPGRYSPARNAVRGETDWAAFAKQNGIKAAGE